MCEKKVYVKNERCDMCNKKCKERAPVNICGEDYWLCRDCYEKEIEVY